MSSALASTAVIGVIGLAVWHANKNPRQRDNPKPTQDIAVGRLNAAANALLQRDPDTAWHILSDTQIDWAWIASAVEEYAKTYPDLPQNQAAQIAELIRKDPQGFLDRLKAVGIQAAANTVQILVRAATDVSAVLVTPTDAAPSA